VIFINNFYLGVDKRIVLRYYTYYVYMIYRHCWI